ncbi:MFS transporter [Shouchella clausii]|uniref:MFS transporter n=1 Tax=Shouchella clausii TaxID=79880 RepID=UPI0031FE04ED
MKHGWIIKGNFFRLWSSTFLSQFSTVLFFYALIWWSLTENGDLLTGSTVIALGALCSLILSPFSGWIADKYHRGKLLAIVDGFLAFVFLMLFFISTYGDTHEGVLVLVCRLIISAVTGATDSTARSLLPQTVNDNNLHRALGFQESLVQISQLISPIIAGFFVFYFGLNGVWILCMLLCFVSAVLECFITDKEQRNSEMELTFSSLISGYIRIKNNGPLRLLLYGTSIQQLLFSGFAIYIAVWSTSALENSEWVSGMLQSFWGIGTLIGALLVVFLLKISNTKHLCVTITVFFGIILAPLGFVGNMILAMTLLLSAGFLSGILNVYLESHLQRQTTTAYRSREISAFFAINQALMPFGYVLAGILSELVPVHYLFIVIVLPIPLVAYFVYQSFTEAGHLTGEKGDLQKMSG